tara:strand:- start:1350 stop:1925 length:576 start_codon:yes stop_codon:yes gene_type:complete
VKTRRCKLCRTKTPESEAVMGGIYSFCSWDHLYEYTTTDQAKKTVKLSYAREAKAVKESLKTASDYVKEAQTAFNAYIRARDRNKPCISCGSPQGETVQGGKFDAGHYRSRGSAGHLRFNALNCWGQCVKCNRYLSGNVVEYRKGLIEKIGADRALQLENDNSQLKFTIDYLKRVKKIFNCRRRLYESKFR